MVQNNTKRSTLYSQLVGKVEESSVKDVIKDIDEANSNPKIKQIVLTIASNGGSLYPAFALFDHIKASKKPVDIIAAGYCMSAAVMLLQAGRKRLSYAHTVFMVHPSAYKVDSYKKDHDLFVGLTIARSGMTKDEFEQIYEPRKYLTPVEALKIGKRGLIDEII